MTVTLPPDLNNFANHFYSDFQVDEATNKFLLERGLVLSDFAEMTEVEFCHLFEENGEVDLLHRLNHGRIIPKLLSRLRSVGIEFLSTDSIYIRGELRTSSKYSPVVHRVLIHKSGVAFSFCRHSSHWAEKMTVVPFGFQNGKRLCSTCVLQSKV